MPYPIIYEVVGVMRCIMFRGLSARLHLGYLASLRHLPLRKLRQHLKRLKNCAQTTTLHCTCIKLNVLCLT
ncbi:unnamed protein product [Schistosoma curassoni]|uniref:SOCS box domain-containing protein n=1 Tax=Schistosoma curassoni TaxID=6186 RepID=A0A183KKW3_9TREM|nr:unnamed protein product [Schistosoma curassoni]